VKTSRVIYLCHPVSGAVESNLAAARRWLRWIYDTQPGVTVVCQWILDCEVLDDSNPDHRAMGLDHDFAIIERCDEIWAVGPRVSTGMALEIEHATRHGIPLLDLVSVYGAEPPAHGKELPPLLAVRTDRRSHG
jgi:hypothetical protein